MKARALAFGSRAVGGDEVLADIKGTFDRAKRVHDKTKAMHDTAKEAQAHVNEVKAAKNELRGAALDLRSEGRKGLAGGRKRGAAEKLISAGADRAAKNGEASSSGGNRDLPSRAAVAAGEIKLSEDLVFTSSLALSKAGHAEAAAADPAGAVTPPILPGRYHDAIPRRYHAAAPARAAPLGRAYSSASPETATTAAVAMSNQPAASGFLAAGWMQPGVENPRNDPVRQHAPSGFLASGCIQRGVEDDPRNRDAFEVD